MDGAEAAERQVRMWRPGEPYPNALLTSSFCSASGRWELPDNSTGMDAYGTMMAQLDRLSDKSSFYGALQGIILLFMIFRMLHLWNFQDQVWSLFHLLGMSHQARMAMHAPWFVLMSMFLFGAGRHCHQNAVQSFAGPRGVRNRPCSVDGFVCHVQHHRRRKPH